MLRILRAALVTLPARPAVPVKLHRRPTLKLAFKR